MRYVIRIVLVLLVFPFPSLADGNESLRTMNGVSLKTYEGFEKTWHIVTVRFRADSGEMRFVYANDLAWDTLVRGGTTYPDGSVFAKTGVATHEDPAFTSSLVPSGSRRFQFMVRDQEKFKGTDGWGYALFDNRGLRYPEDPKIQEIACAACHHIVPDRGFVFSQRMELNSVLAQNQFQPKPVAAMDRVQFRLVDVNSEPSMIKKIIGGDFHQIFLLQGNLKKHFFQGTLDEIKPLLSKKAALTGQPVGLISADGKRFSLAMPDKKSKLCTAGKSTAVRIITSTLDPEKPESDISFCYVQ